MTKDEVFRIWAPERAVWSRWVKPVLFAHVGVGRAAAADPAFDAGDAGDDAWALAQVVPPAALAASYRTPTRAATVAIVVELPGVHAVRAGLALARLGFRPVPLFNAYPAIAARAAVDVWPIVDALEHGAARLSAIALADDAPPAFLLDGDRRGRPFVPPSAFDNRAACTTADFPSAAQLATRGIAHVVVVCPPSARALAPDLRDVLLAFQRGGLSIHQARAAAQAEPAPIRVAPPSWIHRVADALRRVSLSRADERRFGRASAS